MGILLTGASVAKTYIADVPIDVVSRRVFTSGATVTKHPIEDGSSVNDHVIDMPDVLQIDGNISNTPANLIDSLARTGTWAEDEFQKLMDAKIKREPVSVISGPYIYETYEGKGMLIESLVRNDGTGSGESIDFTVTLTKLTKITSPTSAAATRDDNTQSEQQDTGTQVSTPA